MCTWEACCFSISSADANRDYSEGVSPAISWRMSEIASMEVSTSLTFVVVVGLGKWC